MDSSYSTIPTTTAELLLLMANSISSLGTLPVQQYRFSCALVSTRIRARKIIIDRYRLTYRLNNFFRSRDRFAVSLPPENIIGPTT